MLTWVYIDKFGYNNLEGFCLNFWNFIVQYMVILISI